MGSRASEGLDDVWEKTRLGDRSALDELVRFVHDLKARPSWWRCAGKPRPELATETLQETAYRICLKACAGRLDRPLKSAPDTLKAFLRRARRDLLDFRRMAPRGHGRPVPLAKVEGELPPLPDPLMRRADEEDRLRKRAWLKTAIASLPRPTREATRLCLAGLPTTAIARELRCSQAAVWQRWHRAVRSLTDRARRTPPHEFLIDSMSGSAEIIQVNCRGPQVRTGSRP